MKKILILIMSLIIGFSFASCGSDSGGGSSEGNSGDALQGATSGANLEDVSVDNYASIVKETFGIDVGKESNWTISKAESPNGVNNVNLLFTFTDRGDVNAIVENYFNQCKAVATNGVYTQRINDDATGVVKTDPYDDFSKLFEDEGTHFDGFDSIMWLYDNKGADIQFGISITTIDVEITLVLLN